MKRAYILFAVLLLLGAGSWWVHDHYYNVLHSSYHSEIYTPEKYAKLKDSLIVQREVLAADLASAASKDKYKVIGKARKQFMASVNEKIFPFWIGTDWEFEGTTQVPGQGSIACGYFVTTVLRDAGVNVNRSKLAQCASEEMIKALVSEDNTRRFSNVPVEDFKKAVQSWGEGIYVVGLDNHTGFMVCENNKVTFVHSGGGMPPRVMAQDPAEAKLLANSHYRVLAKLTGNEEFLIKWITGEKIK
jgi:hypothetical protein